MPRGDVDEPGVVRTQGVDRRGSRGVRPARPGVGALRSSETPPGGCPIGGVRGTLSAPMSDRRADAAAASAPRNPLRLVRVVELEVRTPPVDELRQSLATAQRVLAMLKADRATIEQRLASQGRGDAVRSVTGRSAIDAAIQDTQQSIRAIEEILGDEESRRDSGG